MFKKLKGRAWKKSKAAPRPVPEVIRRPSSAVFIHSPRMNSGAPRLRQIPELPFSETPNVFSESENHIKGNQTLLTSFILSRVSEYFSYPEYAAVAHLRLGDFFCETLDYSLEYSLRHDYLFNDLIFKLPFWAKKFLMSVFNNPRYLVKYPQLFDIIAEVPDPCWTNSPGMVQDNETPLRLACLLLSSDACFRKPALTTKIASLSLKAWACTTQFNPYIWPFTDINMTPLHVLFSSSDIFWMAEHPILIRRLCSLPDELWGKRGINDLGQITRKPLESLLSSSEGINLVLSHSDFGNLLCRLSEKTWSKRKNALSALGLLLTHDSDNRVLTTFPLLDDKFQEFSEDTLVDAAIHFTDQQILERAFHTGVFSLPYPLFKRVCFMSVKSILNYFKQIVFYQNGAASLEWRIFNQQDGSVTIIKPLIFEHCNILQNALMNLFSVQLLSRSPLLLEKICRLGEVLWAVKSNDSEPENDFSKTRNCEWGVDYSRMYAAFRPKDFSNPFSVKRSLSAIQLICLPDLIYLLEVGKAFEILAKLPLYVWGSIESRGFLKGTSPLSILMSQKRGLVLLSKEPRLIYYLIEMDDHVWTSQGSYDQDSESSCLFSLCRDDAGIDLFYDNLLLLERVLSLPASAWNYVVQKGKHANTSALYWLCHHPSGRELLAINNYFLLKALISKLPVSAWTDVFLREGVGSRRSPLKWLEMYDTTGADLVKNYINDEPDSPAVSALSSIAIS